MIETLKRTVALVLTAGALLSLAACKKQDPIPPEEPGRLNPSTWVNTLTPPDLSNLYLVEVPAENKQKLLDLKSKNADAALWIQIPGTTVNDGVVQTTDNEYYYRRDELKQYSFAGCLWLDYECDVKNGTKADIPQNTIIYGHNLGNPQGVKDDPNDVEFAQLLKFEDPEFAKANPYIYLTTENEDLVYQIFAVLYTEENMKPVPYIYASYPPANRPEYKFKPMVDDLRARSVLNYPDVTVDENDKTLLLSTCCYKYGSYAVNKKQRFVVAAKLVKGSTFSETANVEKNPNPKQPSF